jgi:gamma-glutamylcyclotransferase (GGCT)/AIG2-like uncharacterized protein YtfP
LALPLFVYGTLRDPDVQKLVLGRALEAPETAAATAPDHRAAVYPKQVYPGLIAARGETAQGLLMLDLSPDDMDRLDAYEGKEYARQTLRVKSRGLSEVATVYMPTLAIPADAPGWRLSDWQRNHKAAALVAEAEAAAKSRGRKR